MHAQAVAYLEPAPLSSIDEYGGNRYAPSSGRNIGIGVGFAEVSVPVRSYCIGLLYRAEFEGSASRDLLDVLRGDHYGQRFDAGRTYRVRYEEKILKATGLRVRRAFRFGRTEGPFDITLGLGASLFKAIQGREESLTGTVTATSADYAVGTATWLRTNSDLDPSSFNPFVGAGHPKGLGFSTDVHLKLSFRDATAIDVVVMDALGRTYWRDMRNSLRTLDNATIRYDTNANRKAFVNGVDSRIDHVQRLPAKFHVEASHPVHSKLRMSVADDFVRGIHFVSFGAQYDLAGGSIATSFDVRTHAVGISARWRPISISITSNRWDWRDATAFGASINFGGAW